MGVRETNAAIRAASTPRYQEQSPIAGDFFLPNHSGLSEKTATKQVNNIIHTKHYSSIQAALDALPTTGGTVFIDAGTYNISSSINVTKSNITIDGEGFSSQIVLNNASNCAMFVFTSVDNIIVKNINLDGNKANQSGSTLVHGLQISQCSNVKVQSCYFKNVKMDGIYFSDCDDVQVTGSYFTGCARNGVSCGELSNFKGNRMIITNNHFVANFQGIDIEPAEMSIISNNTFDSDTASSIVVSGTTLYDPTLYVVVANNAIKDAADGAIYINLMDHVVVANNVINSCDEAIHLVDSSECLITGNEIISNTFGVRSRNVTGTSEKQLICGNYFKNNSTTITLASSNDIIYGNFGYSGVSGTFTSADLKTVTVLDGIITSIV